MNSAILLDLTRRYSETHRRYHTIEHIADMLWRGRDLDLSDAQVLAIWYHDAIYDVPGEDNERKSADLADTQLRQAGYPEGEIAVIRTIVLDTITHEATHDESRLVVDLDLASLALPWPDFAQNTRNIREEYACYDDASFRRGQLAMVERFLDRPSIYQSPWGSQFEADARANLERLRQEGIH